MIRRSHLRIGKDKYLPGQYYSGDCTGSKEPSIVEGYTFALLLVEFHTRLKSSYFGVEKTAEVSLYSKNGTKNTCLYGVTFTETFPIFGFTSYLII